MPKRFSIAFQRDSMDCGAACLKMIANYYGIAISQNTVTEICEITRNGISMSAMNKAAGKIGFRTKGVAITLDNLIEKRPFPCILHWNQQHFVVLYDIKIKRFGKSKPKKTLFHIADPNFGKVVFDYSEMQNFWISTTRNNQEVGILLMIEPTFEAYDLKTDSDNKRSIEILLMYVKKYKSILFQLGLGLMFGLLLQVIFPFLTQAIVDIGIGDRDLSFILLVLLGQSMLIFSRTVVEFIRRRLLLHISVRINLSLISDFINKLTKLPMFFFDTKRTGDLLQRMSDHEKIENFITTRTLQTFFSFFTLITFCIILFAYNFKIFFIFTIGSIFYALWISFFLKKRKLLNYKFFNKRSQNQTTTYQLIVGMQEIKLQGCTNRKRWEWEDIQADMLELHSESLRLDQYSEIGNILINEGKNMFITIVAATSVISGNITLGMMLAIQYIIGQLTLPIEQAVQFINSFQEVMISLDRINEIYYKENEVKPDQIALSAHDIGDIYIKNLYFRYDQTNSNYILNNLSFHIPKGKVTAIVGNSGSGKTTLIKLLLSYYKPSDGSIFIENTNLSNVDPNWWREQCGAVMQDGFIFSDSIARNIATHDGDINIENLEYAARIANIHDTVMSLPLKYNTMIGMEGQGLSQGQKQRLLIARAVYKNPQVIFFDEATNSLDAINEKDIVENLKSYYAGKTVVIVAHRLSTVINADKIIVLDTGYVAEEGSHSYLMSKEGYYHRLVKNQLSIGLYS